MASRCSSTRAVTSLVVGCGLAATIVLAQQGDRSRTEALARRAADRLQALEREADQLAGQEQTLLGDLRKLEVERQIKIEELGGINREADSVAAQLQATTDRVQALQTVARSDQAVLDTRFVEIYKLGRGRYLRLLLSTTQLRDLGQAARTVAELAQLDHDRVAAHQRTLDEERSMRASLEERNKQLEHLRADAQDAAAQAEAAARARTALVHDIDGRRDLNAQLSAELEGVQQRLQGALRDLAAGQSAAPVALPLRPFRGDLEWPVKGTVRRPFGRSPGAAASNGIEIAAAEGAAVQAVHEGVVAYADVFGTFGNLVILDHGAQAFSLYGNLLDMAVTRGARVDRGQEIGTIGASPAGPPALYFELRVDGQVVDPLQWLRKR